MLFKENISGNPKHNENLKKQLLFKANIVATDIPKRETTLSKNKLPGPVNVHFEWEVCQAKVASLYALPLNNLIV